MSTIPPPRRAALGPLGDTIDEITEVLTAPWREEMKRIGAGLIARTLAPLYLQPVPVRRAPPDGVTTPRKRGRKTLEELDERESSWREMATESLKLRREGVRNRPQRAARLGVAVGSLRRWERTWLKERPKNGH